MKGAAASLVARVGRALEHPAVLPGVLVACVVFAGAMIWYAANGAPTIGYDAHAYYEAAALDAPYEATASEGFSAVGGQYEYKYPPPLAQLLAPVRMVGVPWPLFFGAWTALLLASLLWMGRRWAFLFLLFPPVLYELWLGNLNILLGLAVVIGMRRPWAWAFILLTKITPGVGLLWFAVRREWRSLGIVAAATAVVALVSFALGPSLWSGFLAASGAQLDATITAPAQAVPIELLVRLVAGSLLVVWGARTDRAWVLPIAVAITVPLLWLNGLAAMVAAVPLAAWRPSGAAGAAAAAA